VSRLHLDLCVAGEDLLVPGPSRDVWVAPRESGKSVWLMVILPLWALAHGHTRFAVLFSYTAGQARGHLANLLGELRTNQLLLWDFPELRIAGGSMTTRFELGGGGAVAARGMGETSQGIRAHADRPTLMIGDDLEPGEARNTLAEVGQQQSRLLHNILPMNSRAVVWINGTVTMYDSLIHQFVHAIKGRAGVEWVRANRFRVHHYPALDDLGRSLWEQRWTTEWLRREREADPHGYGLNYDCDPEKPVHQRFWEPDTFRYNSRFHVAERVLYIDPAVSSRASSDFTVLAMAAADPGRRRALVERCEWGQWNPPQVRELIHDFCAPCVIKPVVLVEGNNGGEALLDAYSPWPVDVEYRLVHSSVSKRMRIEWGFSHYRRRAVDHPWELPELERILCEWPRGAHDDVPDAVAGALLHLWPRVEG
jgi:hypothetical protein